MKRHPYLKNERETKYKKVLHVQLSNLLKKKTYLRELAYWKFSPFCYDPPLLFFLFSPFAGSTPVCPYLASHLPRQENSHLSLPSLSFTSLPSCSPLLFACLFIKFVPSPHFPLYVHLFSHYSERSNREFGAYTFLNPNVPHFKKTRKESKL